MQINEAITPESTGGALDEFCRLLRSPISAQLSAGLSISCVSAVLLHDPAAQHMSHMQAVGAHRAAVKNPSAARRHNVSDVSTVNYS